MKEVFCMAFNQPPYFGFNPYQQPFQQQSPTINGQIVDSIDTAKNFNVPLGSYAVLPKGDLSAVYIKQWLNDGTTRFEEYKRVVSKEFGNNSDATLESIYQSIIDLNNKVDKLKPYSNQPKKKEVVNND